MCGIITAFSKRGKKVNKYVLRTYEAQKTRGTDGFGYVAIYKDSFTTGRSLDEKGIRGQIMNETSGMIMFHHRLPTSTPNVLEATHPIWVSNDELDYNYYIVHNGVVRNSEELRKKHETLGYVYNTVIETETIQHITSKTNGKKYYASMSKIEKFNDSESLAIEVARILDGMTKKIEAVGTIAFVSYKFDKVTNVLLSISYGHNSGNPLTITNNKDYFVLSSLGGTALPTDIIFTLSTNGSTFGTTTQIDIPVGYISDYMRTVNNIVPTYQNNKKDVVIDYKKNSNGVYESNEAYFEEKYGYSSQKRLNWDKEETTSKNIVVTPKKKCGFDTEQRSHGSFKVRSEYYVNQYLESKKNIFHLEQDIITAEYMLDDKDIETSSILMIKAEIKDYEAKIQLCQGGMNEIEDSYYEDLGDLVIFKTLVEAYEEENDAQDETLAKDIEYAER